MRKIKPNMSELDRFYRPTLFTLLDGLSQAEGSKGEVIVMDVNDASILSWVLLEESKGEPGEFVFRTSRVKNVDSISIETEDGRDFVEGGGWNMIPIEPFMPFVAYMYFAKSGCHPLDYFNWNEEKVNLDDAFVNGMYGPLNTVLLECFDNDINALLNYMSEIGVPPIYPNEYPNNLHELIHNELPDLNLLDWACQVVRGKGIRNSLMVRDGKPYTIKLKPKSVQMIKDVLRKSGAKCITKSEKDEDNNIGGYTYVSEKDANRNWYIFSLAFFPSDKPQYGMMVYLKRHEQLQDVVRNEWPELGTYAAKICKAVTEIIMK